MKLSWTLAVVCSFLLFASLQCKKNNTEIALPPETQIGANTFGLKVNGDIYLPKGAILTTPAFDVQYYKSSGGLLIKTNRADKGQSFNIYLYGIYQKSEASIHNPINNSYLYRDDNSNCDFYDRTTSSQTGTVTITRLDTLAKVVSGRFSGIMKQSGCADITITDGRFDLKIDIFN